MASYEKNYFSEGYEIFYTDLTNSLSKLKSQFISVFNEVSLSQNLGAITNESEIIQLYSKNHEIWVAAYDQLRYLPEILGFANHPEILDKVKKCGIKFPSFCGRPIIRADMPNDEKHDFPPHQDYVYNHGSNNSITVWIPFQDVDVEMGALEVIPKSHIEGCVPSKDGIIIDSNLENYIPVEMKTGQILVFSQFLHHKSGQNQSNKIRFSMQLRYNDLSDDSWAKRKFYVNQKILEKTRDVEFKTSFPTEKNVITIET